MTRAEPESTDQPDAGLGDDADAVRAIARGEAGSLEHLAERHERMMLGLALGLMGQRRDTAIDVVQDAWVRVLRSAGTFRGEGTVKAWLAKITVNAARDRLRRERSRSRMQSFRLVRDDDPVAAMHADDTTIHRDDLDAALGSLSELSREIVLLCHCRSLTHAEAARALDIPLGTLKTRLTGAMRDLRAALGEETSR